MPGFGSPQALLRDRQGTFSSGPNRSADKMPAAYEQGVFTSECADKYATFGSPNSWGCVSVHVARRDRLSACRLKPDEDAPQGTASDETNLQ